MPEPTQHEAAIEAGKRAVDQRYAGSIPPQVRHGIAETFLDAYDAARSGDETDFDTLIERHPEAHHWTPGLIADKRSWFEQGLRAARSGEREETQRRIATLTHERDEARSVAARTCVICKGANRARSGEAEGLLLRLRDDEIDAVATVLEESLSEPRSPDEPEAQVHERDVAAALRKLRAAFAEHPEPRQGPRHVVACCPICAAPAAEGCTHEGQLVDGVVTLLSEPRQDQPVRPKGTCVSGLHLLGADCRCGKSRLVEDQPVDRASTERPSEEEIQRAIDRLKSQGKQYIDVRERQPWGRGWDAAFSAARLLLTAVEPTPNQRQAKPNLGDDPHQDVEALREDADEAGRLETDLWEVADALGLETIPGEPRLPERVAAIVAEVERLRPLLSRAYEVIRRGEAVFVEEGIDGCGPLATEIKAALAPSPDDRGGERCPTCKGSHWLNESKLLDGGPMPTACPDCNSDGSKPLAFRAADQSRETSE